MRACAIDQRVAGWEEKTGGKDGAVSQTMKRLGEGLHLSALPLTPKRGLSWRSPAHKTLPQNSHRSETTVTRGRLQPPPPLTPRDTDSRQWPPSCLALKCACARSRELFTTQTPRPNNIFYYFWTIPFTAACLFGLEREEANEVKRKISP